MARKNVRELTKIIKECNDVVELEKLLELENSYDSPRTTIVNQLTKKIDLLSVASKEEVNEGIFPDNLPDKPTVQKMEVVQAEVVKPDPTVLVVIEEEKKLKTIDVEHDFTIEGPKDKEGYRKVKECLKSLLALRKLVTAKKDEVNSPLRERVSENNAKATELVSKIKEVESVLKTRKDQYDQWLLEEKEAREKAREQKRLEAEQKEREAEQAKQAKANTLSSDAFQSKYSGIIARAEAKKKALQEAKEEPVTDSLREAEPDPVLPKKELQKQLNDIEIIQWKLSQLQSILDFDQIPQNEALNKANAVLDKNIQKLVNYAKGVIG